MNASDRHTGQKYGLCNGRKTEKPFAANRKGFKTECVVCSQRYGSANTFTKFRNVERFFSVFAAFDLAQIIFVQYRQFGLEEIERAVLFVLSIIWAFVFLFAKR